MTFLRTDFSDVASEEKKTSKTRENKITYFLLNSDVGKFIFFSRHTKIPMNNFLLINVLLMSFGVCLFNHSGSLTRSQSQRFFANIFR